MINEVVKSNVVEIEVTVNGVQFKKTVEPYLRASDFIRHTLFLTGTHVGCEHGTCGACTIIINDETQRSCLIFAVQLDGKDVRTVEGMGTLDNMHPIQEAFWEKGGLQCGYCTPGMLALASELLAENPDPSIEEIRETVSSNLCRCTGYQSIIESIQLAADKMGRNR